MKGSDRMEVWAVALFVMAAASMLVAAFAIHWIFGWGVLGAILSAGAFAACELAEERRKAENDQESDATKGQP
jgi:hypothetical protein